MARICSNCIFSDLFRVPTVSEKLSVLVSRPAEVILTLQIHTNFIVNTTFLYFVLLFCFTVRYIHIMIFFYSIQFKIICIALFTIQSMQSSFTGNYVSTIDLYIFLIFFYNIVIYIFNLWQNIVNSVYIKELCEIYIYIIK